MHSLLLLRVALLRPVDLGCSNTVKLSVAIGDVWMRWSNWKIARWKSNDWWLLCSLAAICVMTSLFHLTCLGWSVFLSTHLPNYMFSWMWPRLQPVWIPFMYTKYMGELLRLQTSSINLPSTDLPAKSRNPQRSDFRFATGWPLTLKLPFMMCRHNICANLRLHYRVIEGLLLTALEEWPMEFWGVRQFFKSLGGKETMEMLLSSDDGLKICSHAMTTVTMTLCSQIKVKSAAFGRWFVSGPVLVPVSFDWVWLSKSVHVLIFCMRFQHLFCFWTFRGISRFCYLMYPYTQFNDACFYTLSYMCTPFTCMICTANKTTSTKTWLMTHGTLISADFDSPQKPVKPQFSGRRRLK